LKWFASLRALWMFAWNSSSLMLAFTVVLVAYFLITSYKYGQCSSKKRYLVFLSLITNHNHNSKHIPMAMNHSLEIDEQKLPLNTTGTTHSHTRRIHLRATQQLAQVARWWSSFIAHCTLLHFMCFTAASDPYPPFISHHKWQLIACWTLVLKYHPLGVCLLPTQHHITNTFTQPALS
jgi:hypothetical protein